MDQLHVFTWREVDFQQHIAILIVAAVTIMLTLYVGMGLKVKKNCHRLPPGPRPWPIIGSLGLLEPILHQFFAKLAKQHGPIMMFRAGSVTNIIVSSPQFAEQILKTHDRIFASRPNMTQGRILDYDNQAIAFAPYGPYWRHIRKVFILELFTARRMQQFQMVRKEEILCTLHYILDECKGGKTMRMDHSLGDLMKNNITRMMINKSFFGHGSSATILKERSVFVETFKEHFRLLGVVVLGDYIPLLRNFDVQRCKKKMREVRRKKDEMFDGIIEEHRQRICSSEQPAGGEKEVMDIVDVLLTRPSGVDKDPLTDDQIKAILQEAMLAGTETASTTLEWIVSELLRNPTVLKRTQEELDAVVGRDRLVEESDISSLHYLRAVVKEGFRLHPVVPLLIPRESMEACEVGGYYIPSKSQVLVNCWAIGRDPAIWDHPLEFYPERFLITNSKMDVIGQDFELLPFGSGRRGCAGRQLGLLMVQYSLAVLFHACDWILPQGLNPEDVDLSEAPGITLTMATPLQAGASPRLPLPVIYADQKN